MKKHNTIWFLIAMFMLSGCVVRSYQVTKDRPDQDLMSGNRGYVSGDAPLPIERETTRRQRVVEIELHPLVKFEKAPASGKSSKSTVPEPLFRKDDQSTSVGNQGYITRSESLPISEAGEAGIEKYTVVKGDTLQKISQKVYGTTKKWSEIFQANQDRLKGPNKIYPGQVLDIPVQALKEPPENLK
ncbi:Peptidoglycan-binding LysM [sediment metagenome]|uniref:Peptidoglycan-binding LysM n=1 Tax=sediment metagenome TaxID=749907 RepID=D9PK42_9ZZZZ